MKNLSLSELKDIDGGSKLTYYTFWLLGRMFTTPAELDNNGMNPVHLYN